MPRHQRSHGGQAGLKRKGGSAPFSRNRRRFSSRPNQHGPQSCPMCGAVVSDLNSHVRSKHDDPVSHPRD